MKLCSSCFSDFEIESFIISKNEKGHCDFCKKDNEFIIDADELVDFFTDLISCFKPKDGGEDLFKKIQSDWSFFRTNQSAKSILNYFIKKIKCIIPSATEPVEYVDDIQDYVMYWDQIKEDLKWRNRFFVDTSKFGKSNLNGENILISNDSLIELTSSTKLFRARIHTQKGESPFLTSEMGHPPKNQAKSGRANPTGISYLYLSEDPETVVYETRATSHDEISIGIFTVKQEESPIEVFDFTKETSLFKDFVKPTIQRKLLIDKISRDLSKPIRRYDSELDYIPTQFICEYIKVYGKCRGIKFSSSLNPSGFNFVFFEPDLLECISVEKVKVQNQTFSIIKMVD